MSPTPEPIAPAPLRLELELMPATKPIQGRITVAGAVQEFTGWVALCLLLEAALQADSSSRSS